MRKSPWLETADCQIAPYVGGAVKPLTTVDVTSGEAPCWPAARSQKQTLSRSSVNAIPANRRRAVNDVVAITFLPKNLYRTFREWLHSTRDSRLPFSADFGELPRTPRKHFSICLSSLAAPIPRSSSR